MLNIRNLNLISVQSWTYLKSLRLKTVAVALNVEALKNGYLEDPFDGPF